MSATLPRSNAGRRLFAFLFICTSSVGLVLLVLAFAGETLPVHAESDLTASMGVDSQVGQKSVLAPQDVDLEIGKEGPDETYVGRVVTYTIKITNHTGAPINNVVITDAWVASEGGQAAIGAEFNGNYRTNPAGFVQSFTYISPTEQKKEGLARWELVNPLPFDFYGTIEFTMSVPVELQPLHATWSSNVVGPSTLGNSAEITGTGVTANEPDQVVTAILGPVLKLEKFETTEPGVGARPGRLITFSLRLDNLERSDSVPATGIVIWEILPDDFIFEQAWANVPGSAVVFDPGNRHITWTLEPGFALGVGEATTVTLVTRLSTTQAPDRIVSNGTDDCMAISNELAKPVECLNTVRIETLSIFDKSYVTEPDVKKIGSSYGPLAANETYPNRYITYTIYVFNPLSQSVASNLRITDVMPPTWDFIAMVGGDPAPIGSPDDITNTVVWQWPEDLQPGGIISFTFLAHIGAQTPIDNLSCKVGYYNDLAASADEFPIVYEYGKSFGSLDALARVNLIPQVLLKKDADPSSQVAGSLVTYTVTLENQGDRTISLIILTDTLPTFLPYVYFVFDGMLSPPDPFYNVTNTVAWAIPTALNARSEYTLSFRAIADGDWNKDHDNHLDAYSPDTSFCPKDTASVEVLPPVQHEKKADPAWESGAWVVQGEWLTYSVKYWNQSPSYGFTIDEFFDELPIVDASKTSFENYEGLEVAGVPYYDVAVDPPFVLQNNNANSWYHTFTVTATGYAAGSDWCNRLAIAEDDEERFKNQVIYQEASVRDATYGTFHSVAVHGEASAGYFLWVFNSQDEAPIHLKPHVDLFQTVYPKKVGLSGTVEVTLTLYNNMRDWRGGTITPVNDIVLTYTLPEGFTFVEMIPPSLAPTTQTDENLIWADVDLPAGEGEKIDLRFRIRAPFEETSILGSKAYAVAAPADSSICIPNSEAKYYVTKGVEVKKTPDPEATGPFGVVEYTLELFNRTTTPVNGLVITDTLPDGFKFIEVVDGSPEPFSEQPLVWRNITIPASPLSGSSSKFVIRFRARAAGRFGTEFENKVAGLSDSTYVTYTNGYRDDVLVAVLPGVALYKSVWPEEVEVGQTVVYTLTVDNRSGKAIAGVRITDTLPVGLSYQNMVNGSDPVVTAPDLVWTVDNLADMEKAEFVFRVLVGEELATDDYCNQAVATAHEAGDPSSPVSIPDTDLTACVAVKGLPSVQRSKAVAPSTVRAGNLVTYAITLYNDSGAPQTLRLTDTLPLSLTYAGIVGPTPAPVSTSPLVWQNLSLDISETLTLTFQAQVDLYARSGTYYNQLDATTAEFTLPPKLLAPLQVEEVPRYDLQVTKSDGWTKVDEGQALIYTIAYTNATQAGLTLNNVVITDTFSPQLYLSPIGLGGGWQQIAPDQYTYVVGDLGPGESGQVTFTLELATSIPDTIMLISNTAQIGHATAELAFETDASNNRSTDLNILHGSDLLVVGVEVSPAQPQAGQPITFAVTVRNQGDDAAVNALGTGWFPVDLYLKGTGFEPAGPPGAVYPPAVFDHYGSYCGDYPDCAQIRPEYFVYATGLNGNEETTLQFTVIVPQAGDYELYVQVDTSFTGPSVEEPWGHDYGTVLEAIETNNIYSYGVVQVGMGSSAAMIYLPVILKGD